LIGRLCVTDPIRWEYGWRDIFHKRRISILTTNRWLRHVESLKRLKRFPMYRSNDLTI
jgi:hypothetical protein